MRLARRLTFLWLCALSGCRCESPPVTKPEPAELVASPERLEFSSAWVGQSSSGEVAITNRGGSSINVAVSASPPFQANLAGLSLAKGEAETLTIHVTLTAPGALEGTLQVGELIIPLVASGLEVPVCAAQSCTQERFDLNQALCISQPQPDGTSCTGTCIVAGECLSGVCRGTQAACDDADACTIDACASSTGGCSHAPRQCALSTDPCRIAACDPATGCELADVDDGTLCGADDCLLPQVQVCLSGECVMRTRPAQARCTNVWVPATLFTRRSPAVASDPFRGTVLLFGGEGTNSLTPLADTWEWEGTRWTLRLPAASPPPMRTPVMAWDTVRRRMVLVGEHQGSSQTWEWDGVTWLKRDSAGSLPPRLRPGIAYDEARQRVVIFGGYAQGNLADTWEWDGTVWSARAPAHHPPARTGAAMVWDADHQRIVLFAGLGLLNDTWEWNGLDWEQKLPALSPPRRVGPLAWDPLRHRVVLFGGEGVASLGDLWEWDGSTWAQRTLPSSPARSHHGIAYDLRRSELVVVGGSLNGLPAQDTWALNAQGWTQRTPPSPGSRTFHAMAWDDARSRVVLFGGLSDSLAALPPHTWEWDGQGWSRSMGPGPSARTSHAMAFDPLRSRVVLFGGRDTTNTTLGDTWEWDGTSWVEQTPAVAPLPRADAAMAFDGVKGRVFLNGGQPADWEWEWDGLQWQRVELMSGGGRVAMIFDEGAQRMLAIRGGWMGARKYGGGPDWDELTPLHFPGQGSFAIAYDSVRQRTLLFEGTRRETWSWDGTDWSQLAPGDSPPTSSFDNVMVFDRARSRAMLFGQSGAWLYLP